MTSSQAATAPDERTIDELWNSFDRDNTGKIDSSSADAIIRAMKEAMIRDGVENSGAKSLIITVLVHIYARIFNDI
ncbi:hypothetical protein Ae201684P_016175 [Aphanomyces euteiches]|nr:hypothetical protein Ae201684P_016175 [Aphanomyces euteiches]